MTEEIKLLDVVALLTNREDLSLVAGQVGTVVEVLANSFYEVEFSDEEGRSYAMAAFNQKELIVLHYSPVAA